MLSKGVVYILKLSKKKYTHQPAPRQIYPPDPELPFNIYVGSTTVENYSGRMLDHVRGRGAEWTKLYPPFDVMRTIVCDDPTHIENNTVLEMMNMYGPHSVRGGAWVRCTYSDSELTSLISLLDMTFSRCVECHESGHFRKDCPLLHLTQKHTVSTPMATPSIRLGESPMSGPSTPQTVRHNPAVLSAAITQPMFVDAVPQVPPLSTTVTDSPVTYVNQRMDGGMKPLPLTRSVSTPQREESTSSIWGMISSYLPTIGMVTPSPRPRHASIGCTRCGYSTHTIDECYARTHIRGHTLSPKSPYMP